MNNYFIILAAGNSKRFNSKIPKQYSKYQGIMVFEHSVNKSIDSGLFKKVILVINKKHKKYVKNFKNNRVKIIYGADERYKSSLCALKYLKRYNPKYVFIHDAARPNFSIKLLKKMYFQMRKYESVVPFLKPFNSVKINSRI